MTDPEPAVVPVKVTEQLVTPEVVDKPELEELSKPVFGPALRVNVTVPAGALEAVVVSATLAVTESILLVPPTAIIYTLSLHDALPISFDEAVTVTVAASLLLVL